MNKKKTPFKCDECNVYFSARRSLVRHNNTTHKPSKFPCTQCERIFGRVDNLNHHYRVKHKEFWAPSMRKKRSESLSSNLNEISNGPQSQNQSHHNDVHDEQSYDSNRQRYSVEHEEEHSNLFSKIDDDPRLEELDDLRLKVEVEMSSEESISMYPGSEEHQRDIVELTRLTEILERKAANLTPAESVVKVSRKTCCSREELDFTVLDILHQNALDAADEDLMFFKSMLPDLRRIPESRRITVKAKIVALIAEELESEK